MHAYLLTYASIHLYFHVLVRKQILNDIQQIAKHFLLVEYLEHTSAICVLYRISRF